MLSTLLWFLLAAAPDAGARARLPLATVVDRMQKNYDQARDFKARFSQKHTAAAFNRTKVSTGAVTFKKPGLMRWDYESPPQLILSTGQAFWMYEPTDKQAFKNSLKDSQLPAALAFLMGKGKLGDEFEVTLAPEIKYGTPEDYKLSLKPKKPQATYKSIYFIVDPKTFFVRETVLINAQGDINHFTFSKLEVNTKVPPAVFKWTPPEGTRIIDAEKLK